MSTEADAVMTPTYGGKNRGSEGSGDLHEGTQLEAGQGCLGLEAAS